MNKGNETELRTIAHKTSTAVRVLTDWALRQRHRGPVDILKNKRALRNMGEVIDDNEYADMLNDLQKAGYGKVIKDHRGKTRFFELNHPIYAIGKAAIQNTPLEGRTIAAVKRETITAPRAALVTQVPTNPTTNTIVYCVVGDNKIRLELKGEISSKAIDTILETLQSTATHGVKTKAVGNS